MVQVERWNKKLSLARKHSDDQTWAVCFWDMPLQHVSTRLRFHKGQSPHQDCVFINGDGAASWFSPLLCSSWLHMSPSFNGNDWPSGGIPSPPESSQQFLQGLLKLRHGDHLWSSGLILIAWFSNDKRQKISIIGGYWGKKLRIKHTHNQECHK